MWDGHVSAVEHEAGDFVKRKVFGKVCCSFRCRQSPVFIGVKRVVLIVVFEEEPIRFNQFDSRGRAVSQICSFLLLYENEIVDFDC